MKLENICHISSGGTPSRGKSHFYGGDIPWAKISDIENSVNGILTETEEKITKEGLKSIGNRIFPKGTLLFAMYGSIGKVAITGQELATNQAILGIRPKGNDEIYLPYLKIWFETNKQKLINQGRGVALQNLSATIIRNLEVPLPSFSDQLHIANLLTKAENLITQRKQSIAFLDEFLKSTFLEMFGDPVRNEKGWKVETIDKLCTEIVDCVNKTAPLVDYPTDYIMIRTTNVRDLKINFIDTRYVSREVFDKWTRRLLPEKGDIIFTREAPVGEAAIIDFNKSVFLGQRTMQFRPDTNVINKYFLLFQLMGSDVKQQINKLSSGSTVKHLSVPACKKFLIKVPPLDLQSQFAKIVEKTESLKAQYQSSLQELENLYGSLSQRAFRGELIPIQIAEQSHK